MKPERSVPEQSRLCPDCHGVLHEVKVVGFEAEQLRYAVPEARRGSWSGRPSAEGVVGSYLCDDCGRILFYALTTGRP